MNTTTTSTTPAGELKYSLHEATVTGKPGDVDASVVAKATTVTAAPSATSPSSASSSTGNASKRGGGRRRHLTSSDRPVILQLLQQQVSDLRITGMNVYAKNIEHADGTPALAIVLDGIGYLGGDFVLLED